MKIFKWELGFATSLSVPKGTRFLDAQMQNYIPVIWGLVDEEETRSELVDVRLVGTGHTVPVDAGEYVATFQNGALVWHVFVKRIK